MKGYVALTSSNDTTWSTPQWLFDQLHAEFGFTLDVCAQPTNAKCPRYFTPEMDGLSHEWTGVIWMNPPYGKTIAQWVQKAYETSLAGHTVVCLLPARTCTIWFHEWCLRGEIRWIKGRLRFGALKGRATFPSFICIFRGRKAIEAAKRERLKQIGGGCIPQGGVMNYPVGR